MIVITARIYRDKSDTNPIYIDYRDIISADNDLKDRSDMIMPSYGLISNGATLEFRLNDNNREVINIAKQYADTAFCVMYLKNTISGKNQKMSTKYITDIKVDENDKIASMQMVDRLMALQKTSPLMSPPTLTNNPLTGGTDETLPQLLQRYEVQKPFWVYFYWWRYEEQEWVTAHNAKLTQSALYFIKECDAALYYAEQNNLWRHYDELCQALMLHIYIDNNDDMVIDYQYGA